MRLVVDLITRYDWLILALIAPLLFFPTPQRSPALLAVPALWICRKASRGRFIERTPLNLPILLLLAMVLVSLWATYDLEQSLGKVAGMVLGVGIFAALVGALRSYKAWSWAYGALIALGLGVATVGLLASLYRLQGSGLRKNLNLDHAHPTPVG